MHDFVLKPAFPRLRCFSFSGEEGGLVVVVNRYPSSTMAHQKSISSLLYLQSWDDATSLGACRRVGRSPLNVRWGYLDVPDRKLGSMVSKWVRTYLYIYGWSTNPPPPNVPPPEIRPYWGLINHWFPLILGSCCKSYRLEWSRPFQLCPCGSGIRTWHVEIIRMVTMIKFVGVRMISGCAPMNVRCSTAGVWSN